jgi:hypothetical protein
VAALESVATPPVCNLVKFPLAAGEVARGTFKEEDFFPPMPMLHLPLFGVSANPVGVVPASIPSETGSG